MTDTNLKPESASEREFDEQFLKRPFNEWFNSDVWRKHPTQTEPRPFEVARWAAKLTYDRQEKTILELRGLLAEWTEINKYPTVAIKVADDVQRRTTETLARTEVK